jgi:anthranilate phosphoribosyltransferase
MLVGTGDRAAAERMAVVLGMNGITRAWIVNSDDGFDELSTMAPSAVVEVVGDGQGEFELSRWVLEPSTMDFSPSSVDDLRGGDAATNARIVLEVLDGARGPIRDMVLLNAAAALVIADAAESLEAGLESAATSIDEGSARAALDRLIASSHA